MLVSPNFRWYTLVSTFLKSLVSVMLIDDVRSLDLFSYTVLQNMTEFESFGRTVEVYPAGGWPRGRFERVPIVYTVDMSILATPVFSQ